MAQFPKNTDEDDDPVLEKDYPETINVSSIEKEQSDEPELEPSVSSFQPVLGRDQGDKSTVPAFTAQARRPSPFKDTPARREKMDQIVESLKREPPHREAREQEKSFKCGFEH
jgi:hypothetical protein